MKRNSIFYKTVNLTHQEANKKIAFHEAGHAAAICLGNKQKGLPPVYFNICMSPVNAGFTSHPTSSGIDPYYVARIDGGRLIHTLPSSIDEAAENFSSSEKVAYQNAFEADMINLLVGPVAEAKYIALRDGELMNPLMIQASSLYHYGGASDLEDVYKYLNCFLVSEILREQKMAQLLMAAFRFINDRVNWRAITALAEYIACDDQRIIECHQIIEVLESAGYASVSQGFVN